jgi:PAS domain S-box-containing protein
VALTDINGKRVDFLVLPRSITLPGGGQVVAAALATPDPPKDALPDVRFERAQLLTLLEVLPAYVVLIDSEHLVHFANRLFRKLFGSGRGKRCYEVLRNRTTPCQKCPPFTVFSSNAICVSEWADNRSNSAFRVHAYPIQDLDNNRMILKVGINITEGLRARHALDVSEQRYRSITDNLPVGVALLDRHLAAVTVNPRLAEWFGPGVVKGASICDILQHQCSGPEGSCDSCVFRLTLGERRNFEREFSLLTQTGEYRHFRFVSSPILAQSGDAKGITMMLEDTTAHFEMNKHLHHLHKIEAMGTLAGGVAHEINQPLSALHLYASGLQMLLEQNAELPPYLIMERLSFILAEAGKIRDIISHMRALVMNEEGAPLEAVNVRERIEGALALVGSQLAAHGVQIRMEIPDVLPPVLATPVQFEQVLINLLINALHALDTVDRHDKAILVTAQESGQGMVMVCVIDNGPGVQGMEDRIFTPFFTTKSSKLGMGLGLSIVHAYVAAWNGEISVKNNGLTPGATFTVVLHAASAGDAPETL